MAFQVESKGWVWPDNPDEWLPCLREPRTTREEAEEFIRLMKAQDDRDYPYRIVEVLPDPLPEGWQHNG